MIEPAQLYRPGEAAFEVQSSASGFEIEVTLPETIIGRTSIGSEHHATLLDRTDTRFAATLVEIGSRASRTSGFPATFAVRDAPSSLRAGMAAEVAMRLDPTGTEREDLVSIPLSAISIGDDDRRAVFVYRPDSATLERHIVTIAGTENAAALIDAAGSGMLSPGAIVATAGQPFLADGMEVSLVGRGIARYDR